MGRAALLPGAGRETGSVMQDCVFGCSRRVNSRHPPAGIIGPRCYHPVNVPDRRTIGDSPGRVRVAGTAAPVPPSRRRPPCIAGYPEMPRSHPANCIAAASRLPESAPAPAPRLHKNRRQAADSPRPRAPGAGELPVSAYPGGRGDGRRPQNSSPSSVSRLS